MSEPVQPQTSTKGSAIPRICFLLVCLSLIVVSFYRIYFWQSHALLTWADQSVYLEMGKLLMLGQCPYRDFFDFNPPLIMYLSVIPVVVSQIWHCPAAQALSFIVQILAFLSVGLSVYLAYQARKSADLVPTLGMFFAFALATQGLDTCIGEREHLFLLLYLPFFTLRGLVWQNIAINRSLSVFTGCLAGIGLALKPHFLFAAAVADLVFYCHNRQTKYFLRVENLACAAFILLYMAHFLLLPQPALSIYLQQILPIYDAGVYWSSRSLMHMLRAAPYLTWPFVNFLLAISLALFSRARSPWLSPLVAFTCAGFVNYFVGDQAWTYRLVPMLFGSYMILGLLLGQLCDRLLKRFATYSVMPLVLASLLLGTVSVIAIRDIDLTAEEERLERPFDLSALGYSGTCPRHDLSPIFFAILDNTKKGDRVVCIGTGIEPGHPALLQAERSPGSRYIYSILSFVQYDAQTGKHKLPAGLEKEIVEAYGADIKRNKPTLILIQDVPIKEILQRYSFYQEYLSGYRCLGQIAQYSIFKIDDGKSRTEPTRSDRGVEAQNAPGGPADQVEVLIEQNKRLIHKINSLESDNADLRLRLERLEKPGDSVKVRGH